jgi:hypothetical protein
VYDPATVMSYYGAGKHRSRALRLQEIEGEPIQSPAALHQSPT